MSRSSPLADVAVSYVSEDVPNFGDSELTQIRDLFISYFNGTISFPEITRQFTDRQIPLRSLERVEAILRQPDYPLPLHPQEFNAAGQSHMGQRKKIRSWMPFEDQRLLLAIHRYGLDNWGLVSDFVGNGRSRAQCSQRWLRGLDPHIVKDHWSQDDDMKLLTLVALHGNKNWTQISDEFGNRCDVQCRYRYKQLMKSPHFKHQMKEAQEKAKGMKHVAWHRKRHLRTKGSIIQQQQQVPQAIQAVPPPNLTTTLTPTLTQTLTPTLTQTLTQALTPTLAPTNLTNQMNFIPSFNYNQIPQQPPTAQNFQFYPQAITVPQMQPIQFVIMESQNFQQRFPPPPPPPHATATRFAPVFVAPPKAEQAMKNEQPLILQNP